MVSSNSESRCRQTGWPYFCKIFQGTNKTDLHSKNKQTKKNPQYLFKVIETINDCVCVYINNMQTMQANIAVTGAGAIWNAVLFSPYCAKYHLMYHHCAVDVSSSMLDSIEW